MWNRNKRLKAAKGGCKAAEICSRFSVNLSLQATSFLLHVIICCFWSSKIWISGGLKSKKCSEKWTMTVYFKPVWIDVCTVGGCSGELSDQGEDFRGLRLSCRCPCFLLEMYSSKCHQLLDAGYRIRRRLAGPRMTCVTVCLYLPERGWDVVQSIVPKMWLHCNQQFKFTSLNFIWIYFSIQNRMCL